MFTNKILQAIEETEHYLKKALSYSVEFQKPAQIKFYREHLAFLRGEGPETVADRANWNKMNNGANAR